MPARYGDKILRDLISAITNSSRSLNLPVKTRHFHLVEQWQRNMHGHAVRIGTWFKLIRQFEFQIALMPEIRKPACSLVPASSLIKMSVQN